MQRQSKILTGLKEVVNRESAALKKSRVAERLLVANDHYKELVERGIIKNVVLPCVELKIPTFLR